ENQVAERETGAELDGLLSREHRLSGGIRVGAHDCKGIVSIRVLRVEVDRLGGSLHAFLQVRGGRVAPSIPSDTRTHACEPDLRLGQIRIGGAGLSKEVSRSDVPVLGDLVKVPCALTD